MNQVNRTVGTTVGILACLLGGLVCILQLGSGPIQLFFLLVWMWVLVAGSLCIRMKASGRQLLVGAMYLFIATTFLNQSLLSLSAGFFSLFIYRIMMIVCLLILFIQAVGKKGISDVWQEIRVKGALYFLLLWLVYGSVSLLWAQSVIDGVKYLFLIDTGIAFIFLAVFAFTRIRQLTVVFGIWMLMSGLMLAIGLVNHFGRIQLPTSTLYGGPDYKLAYPTAVFTNQNDLATLLAISVFFYLAAARNLRGSAIRLMAFAAALLSVYIIELTESRASLFAVAAGVAFYVFLLLPVKWKKISAAVGGGLLICVLAYLGLHGAIPLDFISQGEGYSVNGAPASNVVRSNMLRSTLSYLADTWGFGVGAGNLSVYLQYMPLYNTNHIYEVHNWLAEITGNFGILIGGGYLAMYAALFFSLFRSYGKLIGRERRMLVEGCITAQVAFLMSSISPSSISNLYFHWVFLGFVVALVSVIQKELLRKEKIVGGLN